MLNFIIRRLGLAIPSLLILIIISFVLMHSAPGGPFTSEKPLPPIVLANIEAKYGLDKPIVKLKLQHKGAEEEFIFGTYNSVTEDQYLLYKNNALPHQLEHYYIDI